MVTVENLTVLKLKNTVGEGGSTGREEMLCVFNERFCMHTRKQERKEMRASDFRSTECSLRSAVHKQADKKQQVLKDRMASSYEAL